VGTVEIAGTVAVGVVNEVGCFIESARCIIVFCDRNKNSKRTLHYSKSETCCQSSCATEVYLNPVPASHIFRGLQSSQMLRSVCWLSTFRPTNQSRLQGSSSQK